MPNGNATVEKWMYWSIIIGYDRAVCEVICACVLI